MSPTKTFVLDFEDQEIIVVSSWHDGVEIFRLEWPDNSFDYLFIDDQEGRSVWRSKTIMDATDTAKIGRLIEQKTSE